MNAILAWLIGISLLMVIKSITMVKDIQTNTVFVAELAENILPGQRITAESLLKDEPLINSRSVELISSLRAHKTMLKEMPEIEYMSSNPFRDIILFKTQNLSIDDLNIFIDELKNIQGIEEIYYDEEFLAFIPHSVKRIRSGILVAAIFFLLAGIIALILRVKRDLRAHKEDIKIMSLAGSEDDQIIAQRRNWSLKWGLISSVIAILMITINILFINLTLLNGLEITFLQTISALLVMLVVVLIILTATTHLTLKTYLSHLNPNF